MSVWRRELVERLAALRLKPEYEAEIVEELSQHLDDRVRDLVALGSDPAATRAVALADLDAPGELTRRLADIIPRPLNLPPVGAPSRGRWLQARWQDVRHSLRSLRRSPAFTAAVIVTLGLTIGPTTAMLSIGNWLFWRPTPGVVEPDRLAVVWVGRWSTRGSSLSFSPSGGLSYLNLDDLRQASKTFTAITGVQEGSASLAVGDLAPSVAGAGWVTADFFEVLGVRVVAGRLFRAEDDQLPAGAQVAVISDGLARRAFGTAADAVGGRLMLNGRPLTIVGVLPPAFTGTQPFSRVDVWYPGATYAYVNHFGGPSRWTTRADGLFYSFIVRLAPDASFEMAQAELDALVRGLAVRHPKENSELESVRARLFDGLGPHVMQRDRYRRLVSVLLVVGGALLLLGCANVANLLMVRSVNRRREHAVRLALGASPGRLLLLHLTEALLLAAGGALLGVGLAVWLKQFVAALLLPSVAGGPFLEVPLDMRVLSMTLGVSIGCGLVAGFVPALLGARRKCTGALSDAGGRSVTATRRVRAGFAVAQLALSLALVTGALMLVATLRTLNAIDLGFEPDGVTTHGIDPSRHGYPPDRASVYYRTMMEKLHGAAGFESFSMSALAPFGSGHTMRLQDPTGTDRDHIEVYANAVSRAYFDVLGMKIVRGRAFTDEEALPSAGKSPVAILSENLARRLFGDIDPIGRVILVPRTSYRAAYPLTVVGVAPDVHWNSVTDEPELFLYLPFNNPEFGVRHATLLVKSPQPLGEVIQRVEATAKEVDPTLPIQYSRALQTSIERSQSDRRLFAWVLSMLGWLAFVLAAVGLYGLLAQSVVERTREFGIRMAIGSERGHIFKLVLRQALWIGALGTALGSGLAFLGSLLIEAQLYGVTRVDPAAYAAAAASLGVVVLLASLWPARAATRIEPVEALRVE
jgi:putative ABC transport system permease protein